MSMSVAYHLITFIMISQRFTMYAIHPFPILPHTHMVGHITPSLLCHTCHRISLHNIMSMRCILLTWHHPSCIAHHFRNNHQFSTVCSMSLLITARIRMTSHHHLYTNHHTSSRGHHGYAAYSAFSASVATCRTSLSLW